jgi:hypothetical protein
LRQQKRFAFEEELASAKLLWNYPKDDLSVISFPKRDNGCLGSDLDSEEFKKLDPSARECVTFLRAPWRTIVRNHAQFKAVDDVQQPEGEEEGSIFFQTIGFLFSNYLWAGKKDLAGLMEHERQEQQSSDQTVVIADPISIDCFRDESVLAGTSVGREMYKGMHLIKV